MALDQDFARAQRWSETVKERSPTEEEGLARQGERSAAVLRGSVRENERSGALCERSGVADRRGSPEPTFAHL
jgi:hypothetical protein